MLITVSQMRTSGLVFDTYVSTEIQKSTITHGSATSSPKIDDSQISDPLLVTRIPLAKILTARQMMHGQDDDTVDGVADVHLVRADTEHLLGDANHMAERTSLGNLPAWTPHSPEERSPPKSSTTSKACLTWRAHHQDFYASKWFRSIQIFIIGCVIAVALILYVLVSPPLGADLFTFPAVIWVFLPLFLGPIPILLLLVVGGMLCSKVFQ